MKRLLVAALLLFFAAVPILAQKRAFTLEDVYRVKAVGDLTATEDGSRIAFTVTSRDLAHAKSSKKIWIANADGSDMRAVTNGEADGSPVFSHDGKSLAFVRDNNIYILSLAGGEARKLTDFSAGVSDPIWSPNGKWIVFSSDVYPECGADDACNKRMSDRRQNGKLHAHMADNTLLFRHWTSWRDGQVTLTFLANVDDGKIRDLTPGTIDFPPFQLGGPLQYDFSPDSTELCVVAIPDKHRETSTNNDLYLISLTDPNAKPRNITAANPAYDGSPKYSPDGKFIAYRTQRIPGYESDLFRLAVYDRTTGQSRVLTEQHNDWIDDFDWSQDSKSIYFTGPYQGINPIWRVDVATGKMADVYRDKTINAFRVARDGKSILYIGAVSDHPAEIYRADLNGSARKTLTHFNDDFVRDVDVRPAEIFWVDGALGAKIQYFIVKPHG
ncbi:MAG TPA: DPP IV N-terminal domain-containing protein, partial [Thermoanaerobaculia bacterium]